jgi:ribonuclease-3
MSADEFNHESLEKAIKLKFKNKEILKQAFIHRSYLNENNNGVTASNERLEFLGDAVLQFLTSEHIYENHSDYTEGNLTNLRSRIVNTESLAQEASRLNLSDYLMISKGERETAAESSYILADTFEALLGAIYIDTKDVAVCRKYLEKQLFYKIPTILEEGELKDSKSLYQEIAQEKYTITPTYKVIEDEGPDHQKTFKVGVYLDSQLIAYGTGASKRKAQQAAAQAAIEKEEAGEEPKMTLLS